MCLVMCLKNQEFQPDCVYKICVYKKKNVYVNMFFCFLLMNRNNEEAAEVLKLTIEAEAKEAEINGKTRHTSTAGNY